MHFNNFYAYSFDKYQNFLFKLVVSFLQIKIKKIKKHSINSQFVIDSQEMNKKINANAVYKFTFSGISLKKKL